MTVQQWRQKGMQQRPWKAHLSQLDLENEQPTGGVFLLQKTGRPPILPKPLGQMLKAINGAGRVQLYAIQVNKQVTLLVYNLYGWTNGNTCREAAARTNSLIQAILEDMALQPPGPMLVLGDINGDPATFHDLQQALNKHTLLDVGAQAQQWGEVPCDYTCRAQGTHRPTRRDYIFANPQAYSLVTHFRVDHKAGLKVHDPIVLQITTTHAHTYHINKLHRPLSLNTLCITNMTKRYGIPPAKSTAPASSTQHHTTQHPHQQATHQAEPTEPFRPLAALFPARLELDGVAGGAISSAAALLFAVERSAFAGVFSSSPPAAFRLAGVRLA